MPGPAWVGEIRGGLQEKVMSKIKDEWRSEPGKADKEERRL